MTAEPTTDDVRWPVPPQQGYTVDDLFTLPNLPPHTELIDGGLVFVAAQNRFHSQMTFLLQLRLRDAVPDGLDVAREMTVVLTNRTALEPDVAIVRAESLTGPEQARFEAADVVLAIEVVSLSSVERDRDTKPHKYAGAGIPHYWRIERDGDRVVAYTFELDQKSERYVPAGTFVNRLTTDRPFAVDIDLTEVDRL